MAAKSTSAEETILFKMDADGSNTVFRRLKDTPIITRCFVNQQDTSLVVVAKLTKTYLGGKYSGIYYLDTALSGIISRKSLRMASREDELSHGLLCGSGAICTCLENTSNY